MTKQQALVEMKYRLSKYILQVLIDEGNYHHRGGHSGQGSLYHKVCHPYTSHGGGRCMADRDV